VIAAERVAFTYGDAAALADVGLAARLDQGIGLIALHDATVQGTPHARSGG